MDRSDRTMLLREVSLFHSLPGEILMAIAERTEPREVAEGEKIFQSGDASEALFFVGSAEVEIRRGDEVLSRLTRADYFGEIGILDDASRKADAVVVKAGTLLSMDRSSFERVTEDLPEVLRVIVRRLISYLR